MLLTPKEADTNATLGLVEAITEPAFIMLCPVRYFKTMAYLHIQLLLELKVISPIFAILDITNGCIIAIRVNLFQRTS